MKPSPIVVDVHLAAPIDRVWQAITDKGLMKKWYFNLEEFIPQTGFRFEFSGGPENGTQYLHLCEITEVIPKQKISYSWRYDGYAGISIVTFELKPAGDFTHLLLTHVGVETFPKDVVDFDKSNFEAGWTYLIRSALKDFLEN